MRREEDRETGVSVEAGEGHISASVSRSRSGTYFYFVKTLHRETENFELTLAKLKKLLVRF